MQISDDKLTDLQLTEIESRINHRHTLYQRWKRYIIGANPPIIDAPHKPDPDNRVPVPFARKIVRTLKGYMFKPGYISYSTEADYIDALKTIFDDNDEELQTAEIATEALSSPEAYEILRIGDTIDTIKMYAVPYNKGYPIYDDTLAKNLVAFAHFETIDDGIDQKYIRTIYYADRYEEYQRQGTAGAWEFVDERAHPFGDVPVAIYRTIQDELPIFQSVLPMIDEHDKVISSSYADERERFANSLMLVLNKLVNGTPEQRAEQLNELKDLRLMQNLGQSETVARVQDAVAFLTKPSRGPDTAEEADRLERLIYDMSMVINPTDEAFAAASGIALKYKLLPMEFLAADIEAYFARGLQTRIELIGNALQGLRNVTPEPVTIHWRRNLPTDIEALVETSSKAQGILSQQTVLQMFPADIIPDIGAEIERLAGERDPLAFDDFVVESEDE